MSTNTMHRVMSIILSVFCIFLASCAAAPRHEIHMGDVFADSGLVLERLNFVSIQGKGERTVRFNNTAKTEDVLAGRPWTPPRVIELDREDDTPLDICLQPASKMAGDRILAAEAVIPGNDVQNFLLQGLTPNTSEPSQPCYDKTGGTIYLGALPFPEKNEGVIKITIYYLVKNVVLSDRPANTRYFFTREVRRIPYHVI